MQEVDAIVELAWGQFKPLFRLLGYGGPRIGEACALRVEDLDLDHSIITIWRSTWEGHTGKTKNGKPRGVYLDHITVQMLREHLAGRKSGQVFPSRAGTPLRGREICRWVLWPILEKLGISKASCHAFRHARASHMQAHGMPADFVLSQIGHSSLKITSKYTHFDHQTKRNLAEQFAVLFSKSAVVLSAELT